MSYALYSSPIQTSNVFLMDVDGTLVTSKSGRRWAQDENDWMFLGPIPAVLQELHTKGWTIVLVSNQSEWTTSPGPKAKIESILGALQTANGWAPWALIATATRKEKDTVYRKPGRGLYDLLLKQFKEPVETVHMCGDAIGPSDPYPPYQWSDSDRLFAKGIGADFFRPVDVFNPSPPLSLSPRQELVVLMGNPGSGKSTTARFLAGLGYVHVEQDVTGSKAATLKAVKQVLATGASVTVDATHGSEINRQPYRELAGDLKIPCQILWHIRDGRSFNSARKEPVPEVAYAMYSKHFVEPVGATLVY
jgi:bifunctional polynucleotide phosphatase/kinase